MEYSNVKNKYKVKYDDGDLLWETYDDGFNILSLPEGQKTKKVRTK